MKNATASAIFFASLVLTIPLMALLQTLCDRFYPFANSGWVVYGLSLIVSLGSCFFVGALAEHRFGGHKAQEKTTAFRPGTIKKEKTLEFWVFTVVCMVICSIFLDALFRQFPVLVKHHPTGMSVFGLFAGIQLSKVLGHKNGWMIEQPVHGETQEKS